MPASSSPRPSTSGARPGGDDEPLRARGLAGDGERHLVLAGHDVLDEDARADLDALLLEAAIGELGDVGVLGRQDAIEALVERDVRAQARVRRRDLGARRARADDGQRVGQLGQRPRLLGADDAAAELRARQRLLHRAGREDDELRRVLRAVEVAADLDVGVVGHDAVALDDVDLVLLEEAGDAARERLDDLLAALADGVEVDERVRDRRSRSPPRCGSRSARRPRAAPLSRGCRRSSGSARRPGRTRRRRSSCPAVRPGSPRRSRRARSR